MHVISSHASSWYGRWAGKKDRQLSLFCRCIPLCGFILFDRSIGVIQGIVTIPRSVCTVDALAEPL